jgi:flavin reductase (DIM6/NTAB) family NADH-FMN oxidoreductase RutF
LSQSIIKKTGDFVINIPAADILKEVDTCGVISGREADKFRRCGLHAEESRKVSSPRIKECPVNIECKLRDMKRLGSHDMFLGEVVAVHVDEALLDRNGKIDYKKANPIVYNQGEYWNIGEHLASYGFSG